MNRPTCSNRTRTGAGLAVALLLTAGCSGGSSGGGDSVVIGASLPLTGGLSALGSIIQEGSQAAVDAANADGGVTVDGEQRQVELAVLDSRSDPNLVADQSESLVLEQEVVGLLGSISPPLTIPASTVADLEQVPLVASQTPLNAWLEGNESGWQYAWNLFFDEDEMTDQQFLTADLVPTNKRVALFTDTEDDGVVMGGLWEEKAPDFGYEVAYRAEFPVGTTEYTSFIREAQAAQAEVVIAQMIPPDALALWKQMKALGYAPQVAFAEKAAAADAFAAELGPIAEGTLVTHGWTDRGDEATAALLEEYGGEYGEAADMANFMLSYTAASVLIDAVERAGSTDPDAVNEAIAATDGSYPVGDVRFADDHTYAVTPAVAQIGGGSRANVYHPDGLGVSPLVAPAPGLQ